MNITEKHLQGFRNTELHTQNFISQWKRYFREKPVDVDIVFCFDKFGPLYTAIKQSPELTASTKPLSWFLDNYEKITQGEIK